jgi:protein-S-isoprenylcysteine O-methyltransferase Ste14
MAGAVHPDYFLRAYLVAGLVIHKAVWEILKRQAVPAAKAATGMLALIKLAKIAVLAWIILQAILPIAILPILPQARPELLWTGLLFYTAGLLIAIAARIQLGRNWSDIEIAHLKREHALVSGGLYRLIRHPIYTGDLLLLFGLELSLNSWLVLAVAALAIAVSAKAAREEKNLIGGLPAYAAYYRRTKRFIPFVF